MSPHLYLHLRLGPLTLTIGDNDSEGMRDYEIGGTWIDAGDTDTCLGFTNGRESE